MDQLSQTNEGQMIEAQSDVRKSPKDAHPAVRAAHAAMLASLPFDDTRDFDDARRGFIGTIPDATIANAQGRAVWTLKPYDFLSSDTAPETVNPSLWRQARLNMQHGLFEVTERIYQVRGLDIANMTLIEGDTGVIVVDTLTSSEGARAALDLYFKHRGRRPIAAVIYTHTHTDHWGGVGGVLSREDAASGKVPILAPNFFLEYAASENVIAGNAMLRRAQYQFGPFLPRGPRGQVDCGLGKAMATGTVSLLAPSDLITFTGETRTIDGVQFVFQMAPESEAPAEFHFYLPQFKTLNMAENATHNFHNLLPFRGSEVRNAQAWSGYLGEALRMWGDDAEILIGQHHWPVWDKARVQTHLKQQRDVYKFVHDQTIRMLNHGLTASEISEQIALPKCLDAAWHTRGYYGHVRHNVKAVYQRTLGWYDGNPAHLDPLPPVALGKGLVAYMGGGASVLERARTDFRNGEFRIVAEVINHLVFAEPGNEDARFLLADTYEQLGYASESAAWRNAYLFGAQELRFGMPKAPNRSAISDDTLRALGAEQLFDYLGVRLIGDAAEGAHSIINFRFTDSGSLFVLNLENSALTYVSDHNADHAHLTLALDLITFGDLVMEKTRIAQAIAAGKVSAEGDPSQFQRLMDMMDSFERMFEIVEPRSASPAVDGRKSITA